MSRTTFSTDAQPQTRNFTRPADGRSEIRCLVKGGNVIGAGVCVREQVEGCFCPHGQPAIESEIQRLASGPKQDPPEAEVRALDNQRAQLAPLRIRAQGLMRKPEAQQFAGSALRVVNEKIAAANRPVPRQRSLLQLSPGDDRASGDGRPFSDPTPMPAPVAAPRKKVSAEHVGAEANSTPRTSAPTVASSGSVPPAAPATGGLPAEEPRTCRRPGCEIELRSDNKSWFCPGCYVGTSSTPVRTCSRPGCERSLRSDNATGICGVCQAGHVQPSRASGEAKFCTVDGCGARLRSDNQTGICNFHRRSGQAHARPPGLGRFGAAAQPAAAPAAPSIVGDLTQLSTDYLIACATELKRRLQAVSLSGVL